MARPFRCLLCASHLDDLRIRQRPLVSARLAEGDALGHRDGRFRGHHLSQLVRQLCQVLLRHLQAVVLHKRVQLVLLRSGEGGFRA